MVGEGKSSSVSAPSSEMVSNFETLEGFLGEMRRAGATSIHCCRYLASFAMALEEDSPSFFLSFFLQNLPYMVLGEEFLRWMWTEILVEVLI